MALMSILELLLQNIWVNPFQRSIWKPWFTEEEREFSKHVQIFSFVQPVATQIIDMLFAVLALDQFHG